MRQRADMSLDRLKRSLSRPSPPPLSPELTALWWAAKGDWNKAHGIVMDAGGRDAAWIHAYLHRVEGDVDNARYWYRQAARAPATGLLEAEWVDIATILLQPGAGKAPRSRT
jgi:hypothetical protein